MSLSPVDYEAIVGFSPNMIWRADVDGVRDYFNQKWLDFTGRTLAEEVRDGWMDQIFAEDRARFTKAYSWALDHREPFELEYRLRRRDGEWRWLNDRAAPYFLKDEFAGFIGSAIDINERAESERLKDLALSDGLTGLYRRRYFEQRVDQEIRRAKRYRQELALVKLDVDEFKQLNVRYGREAGDKILKSLAQLVRENIRGHDIACRLGGDEFCISLPQTSAKQAMILAKRISHLAGKTSLTYDRRPIDFMVSCAVIELSDEPNANQLMSKVDRALFEVKRPAAKAA